MNPLVSAASAHYENLFGLASPFWNEVWPAVLFGVFALAGVLLFGAASGVIQKQGAVALRVLGVFAFLAALVFPVGQYLMGTQQSNVLVAHINDNLKQKYGVTLNGRDSGLPVNMSDESLSTPMKLNVVFPDGTPAQYTIHFDRQTSEPFILNNKPPTPDQMNQNANK